MAGAFQCDHEGCTNERPLSAAPDAAWFLVDVLGPGGTGAHREFCSTAHLGAALEGLEELVPGPPEEPEPPPEP